MLRNIQALRGIACLLVVYYHVAGWENLVWPRVRLFYPVRYFGYAGVDLFFVLSGFILVRSQLASPQRWHAFLRRRAGRIFPTWWAALFTTVILSALVAKQSCFGDDWPAEWLAWLTLAPVADGCRILPVSWSLTYELMFYLAFALVLAMPRRLAILAIAAWAVAFCVQPEANVFALKMPFSPFVLEFLAGAFVAWLRPGFRRWMLPAALAWAVAFVAALPGETPDALGGRIAWRVAAFGPSSALVVAACAASEGRWNFPRWLVFLGDASYSIYLFHGIFCVCVLFGTWGMSHAMLPHIAWLTMMVAGGVGGGVGMYWLVERQAGRFRRKVVPTPGVESTLTAPPCSAMIFRTTNSPRPVPCRLVVK